MAINNLDFNLEKAYFMAHLFSAILTMTFFVIPLIAQENPTENIAISGKVTDTNGKAIPGALVKLEKAKLSDTSNDKGEFSLKYQTSLPIFKRASLLSNKLEASLHNNILTIFAAEPSAVSITSHSLQGKVLSKAQRNLTPGVHSIHVPTTSANICLYKVVSGNREIILKGLSMDGRRQTSELTPSSASTQVLEKATSVAAAFADVLKVSKNGFMDFSMNIDNAIKSGLTIQLKPRQTTPIKDTELIGWASGSECGENGTTGGAGGDTVTVTDGAALKANMNSSDPKVIIVSGSIKTPGNFSGRKNKTLIGVNNAEIYGGSGLVVCKNIIVKNIKFRDGPNDSFGCSGSTCIWIDHCEFVDGADGNFDIVNGTDFVTISWSKFYYTKSHSHMLACLVGNTQNNPSDPGKLRITFHHNWWGAGIKSRAPRVRFGKVHVFNNYYKYENVGGSGGHNYSIGGGIQSKLVVENNFFESSIKNAFTYISDNGTSQVVAKGNVGGGVPNKGASFKPPYNYTLTSAEEAKTAVIKDAGVQ